MAEALPDALDLLLPTDMAFVRPGRKMVESLMAAQGWSEEAIEDVALVTTELLQNAIEHGSRADGTERARLRVEMHEDAIVLEVLDPGSGCDPRELLDRDVTEPVALDAPRGRGLFLIHRMARSLERARASTGGCVVRVRMEDEA